MKLSVLLFALKLKLTVLALASAAFRAKLRQKDCVLVIRTADRRRSRSFRFSKGSVSSRRGMDTDPDTELIWDDASTAFRVMASGRDTAILEAIGKSQLKILGNLEYALWFTAIAN